MMKKPCSHFILGLLLLALVLVFPPSNSLADDSETWVVIVAGFDAGSLWHPFLTNSYYAYFVFAHHYGVPDNETDEHIKYYYDHYPLEIEDHTVDGPSTKENVRSAIAWLSIVSDDNDNIFIYITCHGAGALQNGTLEGDARIDSEGDEGREFYSNGTWFGVDELLEVYKDETTGTSENYYDDEFKQDLSNVTCGQMIILLQACEIGNQTCFSGGFIDDLSAPNRIIITSCNETSVSWGDYSVDFQLGVEDGFSEFSEGFFDALYGFDTSMIGDIFIAYPDRPINADYDENGVVSYKEAYTYAFEHDDAREAVRTQNGTIPDPLDWYEASINDTVDESPWMDDDGDGLPTFKAGYDIFLLGDFNFDGKVDMTDVNMFLNAYNSPYHPLYDLNDDGDIDGWDLPILISICEKRVLYIYRNNASGTTDPLPGTHKYILGSSVTVTATPDSFFLYWLLDGAEVCDNPINVTMDSNHTLMACFTSYVCPTLFVWNGTDYAEEGLLNIHADSDITVQHTIQSTLTLKNGFYKLQLRELDNFTSHIDQVRLYAVDSEGEWHICPLILAKHNDTYVTLKLLFDDQNRVDLAPSQIIDLKFLPSIPYSQTTNFIFEINGYNAKIP